MLVEVKRKTATGDSEYQTISELIALDRRSRQLVIGFLTDVKKTWTLFWVGGDRAIKIVRFDRADEAFAVLRTWLALTPDPTPDHQSFKLPGVEGQVERCKLNFA